MSRPRLAAIAAALGAIAATPQLAVAEPAAPPPPTAPDRVLRPAPERHAQPPDRPVLRPTHEPSTTPTRQPPDRPVLRPAHEPSRAQPPDRPVLRLTREPPPRHLRMRPRAAQVTPPPRRPTTPMPAAPPPLSLEDLGDRGDELAGLRDVLQPISFSLAVGYQVDSAQPTGQQSLDAPIQEGRDYNALRSYGFGELFFSTRGVALDSLSSYFALRFDAARQDFYQPPGQTQLVRVAPPIATWFERNTFEVRTGWGEVKDFLPRRLGLRKLRLRAGSQYIYGPWVMHLDGALLAYDGDIVTASGYFGARHADYTRELTPESYAIAGASLRIDLRNLVSVPVAITGETLALQSFIDGQPDSAHRQLEVDWQPRRDFTVFAQVRTRDDKVANQRLQFRARYREVTNLVFDVMRRLDTDWRWDPSLVAPEDPMTARRYLDLGPVLPQLIVSLRGGTLIAENLDLLVRTTLAGELTDPGEPTSSFSASYVEIGGALDVRLRRTIAVGASALSRQTRREVLEAGPIVDEAGPQPLPQSAATGEAGLTEVGTRVRMTLGARRLSALLEVYGRRTRYADLYLDADPDNPVPVSDVRGGGRFSIDAWIGKRLRLFASYDLSSAFDFLPDITSYKSLRLTMTGVY